jgi:Na+/glutamate symporter
LTVTSDVIESLSLHLVFVGAAVLIGWMMQQGLIGLASGMPQTAKYIFEKFPLFPLCMLGGVIVQWLADRFDRHEHMDEQLMLRIQNCALDFLVVAAIANIKLDVVNIKPRPPRPSLPSSCCTNPLWAAVSGPARPFRCSPLSAAGPFSASP